MKAHTSEFKNQIKLLGREIDSKITYTLDNEEIELGAEELNSITPSFKGSILKSVMKEIEIDCNTEIPLGTEINYQFGIKVNGIYEYLNYGNYIVNKVEKQEDTYSWIITAYDKMLYSMTDYVNLGITYPITIRNYINTIANHLGLTFANINETFCNYDKEIQNELFLSSDGTSINYTFRDVLDQLAEVTGSMICINDDDEIELRYINLTEPEDTINEEYLKDINVKFGEKFGPVNSIVLSRASESDNVYLQDEESIEENGLCEIKIKENQIMNFNDRSDYLEDLLETLDGLEFYINDFSSTGIAYLELGDIYNISVDNNVYKCLMLNDTLNVSRGLSEDIYTDRPDKSETDYKKADKTDRRINQAYIIVDKQNQEITALTSRTSMLEENTNNMYTKEQVNQLVINAESGLTNTFTEAGGNNIFKNTGLWFESTQKKYLYPSDDLYPSDNLFMSADSYYEDWDGYVKRNSNLNAMNGNSLLLQTGYLAQEQQVPNGNYTVSFKYKKLIELATCTVKINDDEYTLSELTDTEFQTGLLDNNGEYITKPLEVSSNKIQVLFYTDTDNSIEIYDLMVNAGKVKLAYSQNQNESHTTNVNISNGITITDTNSETTFKANADGIRTLNSNGDELSKFTDKGMYIEEAEINKKATITGTLIQEVDDQTWFTRL